MTKTLRIALAVVIAIVLALSGWGYLEHKAYVKAQAKADLLRADYQAYVEHAERIKADLATEAKVHLAAKNAAIDQALAAESAKAQAIKERDEALAKTAALDPDTLSGSINLRIGAGQSYPTGDGRFSFSRPGAESVLDRFIAGEADASLYAAERSVSSSLRDALSASERESGNLGQRLYLTQGELDRAVKAWGAETDAHAHLRRSIVGRTVTTAAISFGVGVGIAALLHAVGVIK